MICTPTRTNTDRAQPQAYRSQLSIQTVTSKQKILDFHLDKNGLPLWRKAHFVVTPFPRQQLVIFPTETNGLALVEWERNQLPVSSYLERIRKRTNLGANKKILPNFAALDIAGRPSLDQQTQRLSDRPHPLDLPFQNIRSKHNQEKKARTAANLGKTVVIHALSVKLWVERSQAETERGAFLDEKIDSGIGSVEEVGVAGIGTEGGECEN